MYANIARSILGPAAVWPGSRPTGAKCERQRAPPRSRLIGQTGLTLQADVKIWGHFFTAAILGLLTRRANTNCIN